MTDARVVLVTFPADTQAARAFSRTLVEEGLIACANLVSGITSIYRWQGDLIEDGEILLVLKTQAFRVPRLLERVPQIHPYDVPEVLVLSVETGHTPYLRWLDRETGGPGGG
jgi:periplasmic divalent cation tolerance protein